MNETEREAIILNSAWEMIDGMVNWAVFEKTDKTELSNLWFPSTQHRELFLILLVDFLSQPRGFGGRPVPLGLKDPPSGTTPANLTFLFHLREVCKKPILGGDPASLSLAIEGFATWLECEFKASEVNTHNIDVPVDITVSRLQYIKMCGDIAKHNLARLEANMQKLQKLLKAAGHDVDDSTAYLAIPSFYEWFENIFIYHASQIAEFLNNIRLEIYRYLQTEFVRSYHKKENWSEQFPIYGYHVPEAIEEPIAYAMYWDVMNRSRSQPYVQRFKIPDLMKRQY